MLAMFSDSRKSVVRSNKVGKVEREIELGIYIDSISKLMDIPRLVAMKASIKAVGTGRIIKEIMATTSTARTISL